MKSDGEPKATDHKDEVTDYAPCPFCKQYSHSLGEGQVAAAFNHFQTMIAHPVRGHPMGDAFDEQTRNAAQVLMTAALANHAADEVTQEFSVKEIG